ncbi:MAG: helix-turn-helix transcriptional regulator [Bacillota bacterium]|nr:helix-turn-helix transcriptional regulator [Bacillota bacterium]
MFIKKSRYNWKYILPMSFFTAWLWSYPLFGHLQGFFLYDESVFFTWNLLFLLGLSIGFFAHVFKYFDKFSKIHISIITFASLAFMFLSSRISFDNSQFINNIGFFSTFLMGISSSIYMVKWSSELVLIKKDTIGNHMGMMMLVATFLYSIILVLGESILSLYIAFGFLIASSFNFQSDLKSGIINENQREISTTLKYRILKFWFPFILILLSFYIFSNILLNYIFPSVRVDAPIMYILASLIYGGTAFLGGNFLDRSKKLENIVLIGIVMLGIFYFVSPILESLPIINIGLEISYALIDLFIWVGIAYASIKFNYNPVRCFGFGLGLNIIFVLLGFLADDFMTGGLEFFDFYSIALLVGMMMLVSIFPALSMKNINILKEKASIGYGKIIGIPDSLTPREKQVFKLLMTKMKNEEIQDKLSISKNTLKTHIRNVYAKSRVKSRYELVVKYKNEKSDKGR